MPISPCLDQAARATVTGFAPIRVTQAPCAMPQVGLNQAAALIDIHHAMMCEST